MNRPDTVSRQTKGHTMRKLTTIILALTLGLTACGGGFPEGAEPYNEFLAIWTEDKPWNIVDDYTDDELVEWGYGICDEIEKEGDYMWTLMGGLNFDYQIDAKAWTHMVDASLLFLCPELYPNESDRDYHIGEDTDRILRQMDVEWDFESREG